MSVGGGVLDLFLDFSEERTNVVVGESSREEEEAPPPPPPLLGGEIIYVDEEDELLTVQPQPNKLTMVYRTDRDVHGFVRYLPRSCPAATNRQDFMVQYQVR